MFLFPYKVFDNIRLLKQVLKIQSFYGIKQLKWSKISVRNNRFMLSTLKKV